MKKRFRQGGGVLLRVLLFSLLLTLVFTLTANLLPQVEGEAPVDREIDLAALTLDGFVALGETIFKGKGTCTLCHNDMGRAPDILAIDMVETAKEHLADPRYRGQATTVTEYLHESLVDPSVYVVRGYGKKGSNDTISPMPAVDKAPIQLNEVEMNAVIAFMEAKDGHEVSVPLPDSLPDDAPEPAGGEPAATATPVAAQSPEEALGKHGCTACHAIAGSEATLGPDLRSVGARLDAPAIRQSIVDPDAAIAEGYDAGLMPADIADKMTVSELEMIVDYLLRQRGGQ